MITGEFDLVMLRRSIERAARALGETNRDAIARWGVQTCRELAKSTQVFGSSAKSRKKQIGAIEAGIWTTIATVTDRQFRQLQSSGRMRSLKIRNQWTVPTSDRLLASVAECNAWIESHRENGRTAQLGQQQIGITSKAVMKALKESRRALAWKAKGGWIGAGQAIARRQRGAQRIEIGASFLPQAHVHAHKGSARASGSDMRAFADLINGYGHSSKSNVLSLSERKRAVGFGAKKTLQWYRMAARNRLNR